MTTDTGSTTLRHEIGPDGLLVLAVSGGDLRLRGVSGGEVRVRARDGRSIEGLPVERGEGSLTIQGGRGRGAAPGGLRHGTPDLDVDVPATANVVVEVASSDVVADGLIGDQRFRSASGDLEIRGAEGTLTVEAMSGDIEVVAAGPARYDLRSVSGDLRLLAQRIDALHAVTTSGDLTIEGRFEGAGTFLVETVSGDIELAPIGDVRVDVRTISGDLHSGLPGRMEEGGGRRSFLVGSGAPAVDIRSTSGDVHIGRPGPTAAAAPPAPIAPPVAAIPPAPAPAEPPPAPNAGDAEDDDPGLDVLRALERGDIDLEEARHRLAALDDDPETAGPVDEPAAIADAAADADTAVVRTATTAEESDDER